MLTRLTKQCIIAQLQSFDATSCHSLSIGLELIVQQTGQHWHPTLVTPKCVALVYSGPANYYIKKMKVTFGRKAAMPIQNRLTVA